MENIEQTKRKILEQSPKEFSCSIAKAMEYIKNEDPNMVSHLLDTALIVAENGFDTATIIAAILHDANPDESFDKEILSLVKGVRQIEATTRNEDTKDEIITKYILNNTKDLRAVIIKLASVLDKARHPENVKPEKQKIYFKQAITIYSDIAEYLDFGSIKKEIDERIFQMQKPLEYEAIDKKYQEAGVNDKLFDRYLNILQGNSKNLDVNIYGRIKSKYSVYNKLKKYEKEWKNPNIKSLSDIIAFRCITDTTDSCFSILEKIMDTGELNTELFDDYISAPKSNGYQAIHCSVTFEQIAPLPIEVQILTRDMHYINTYGKASHIAYKISKSRYANPTDKYNWIEDVHKAIENNKILREREVNIPISTNLFQEDIFAFTPKGEIIQLSKGDTALDFAYRIHSQIGNSAVAVKINGMAAKLGQILKTGDLVEIKTQKDKKCQDLNTLQYAHSQSTKSRILKSIFKNQRN